MVPFLLVLPSVLSAQQTIKIGIFELAPFMMEVGPEKKAGGAAIDYWEKYIAPAMGVKVEGVGPFPAARIMKMLQDGDVDAIMNMTKVPAREAAFIFPPTPLAETMSCLVVLKDSPLEVVTKQEDLFNLRIGAQEGAYVPPLLLDRRIAMETVSDTNWMQTLLAKLEAGRNDAFLRVNYLSLLYDLKRLGANDKVRVIMLPEEKIKVYCIFQKSERGLRLSQEFDAINAKYYGTQIYDDLARAYLK